MAEIGLQRAGISAPNSPGHSRKHVSAPATKAGNRIYGTRDWLHHGHFTP